MWTYVLLEGETEEAPGLFGDSNKKKYKCYVTFSSLRDNEQLVKQYFLYYCNCDYDKLEYSRRPPLDDFNCSMAIITYYFRDQFLRFKRKTFEFSRPADFPDRGPDKETEQYKIWVDVIEDQPVTTPKSAAWMLYGVVGEQGKITVEYAKSLVREQFPQHMHAWNQVLDEFVKYGGAHTEKCLRRRR